MNDDELAALPKPRPSCPKCKGRLPTCEDVAYRKQCENCWVDMVFGRYRKSEIKKPRLLDTFALMEEEDRQSKLPKRSRRFVTMGDN